MKEYQVIPSQNPNMIYQAIRPDGTKATLKGTWSLGPFLSFYDTEREFWLGELDWQWKLQN